MHNELRNLMRRRKRACDIAKQTQSDLNDTNKEVHFITTTKQNQLSAIKANLDEVKSLIDTLKIGKAAGPDKINKYIIETCSSELSYSLSESL